jgi:excisionase family DNA binding protein
MKNIQQQLERIERNALLAAKNVLTVDDLAVLTGMSKRTIYRFTSSRQIPFYKPNNKVVYFNRNEVENWLLQNRSATDQEIQEEATKRVVLGNTNKKQANRG